MASRGGRFNPLPPARPRAHAHMHARTRTLLFARALTRTCTCVRACVRACATCTCACVSGSRSVCSLFRCNVLFLCSLAVFLFPARSLGQGRHCAGCLEAEPSLPGNGAHGVPCRMGYCAGWDITPDGTPRRMVNGAACDTMPCGIPCRAGYHAVWDTEPCKMMPCRDTRPHISRAIHGLGSSAVRHVPCRMGYRCLTGLLGCCGARDAALRAIRLGWGHCAVRHVETADSGGGDRAHPQYPANNAHPSASARRRKYPWTQ
jgi:hypothetical protein